MGLLLLSICQAEIMPSVMLYGKYSILQVKCPTNGTSTSFNLSGRDPPCDVVPHPVTVKDTSSQSSFRFRLTGATRPLVKFKGVSNFNKHTSLLVLEAE